MIIGIIGGGQLGMMIAEAAKELNHQIIGLDPNQSCSLSYVADKMIYANYNDEKAIKELTLKSDVITYEFENIDLNMIEKYLEYIPQKSKGLSKSRDRIIEKMYAQKLGIPTVKFKEYISPKDIFAPAIIKTSTGGYDGKGQYIINKIIDIDHLRLITDKKYVIEEFLDFDYEISVVASRDIFGSVVTYPVAKNTHRNGILFVSEIFNDIEVEVIKKAIGYTKKLIVDLDYVGTMAVEYFVKDSKVIFNEFAPRPHNSGHYTIEGCNVSQFKNHVLAITGQKVIIPNLLKPTIMINILGQDNTFIERSNNIDSSLHLYHKRDSLHNRKMGHLTLIFNTKNECIEAKNYIVEE